VEIAKLTEEQLLVIVHEITPLVQKTVRDEVSLQLSGFSSRLLSIETQASANGEQTMEARRETAGIASMLTAFFGTDGSGGTLGIMMKNSAADSRRANDLAHKIYGHLDTLVGRGWLNKQIEDDALVAVEKKNDKRWGAIKWGGGILAGGGLFTKFWSIILNWWHRHWM
jgi:hypothetical protein